MVQILHQSVKDLHEYAALRSVPALSETGAAEGAFLYLYDCPNGSSVFAYYRPETIHAFAEGGDYQVIVTDGRAVSCDCPSATYRKDGKTCKHVDAYNAQADMKAAPVKAPAVPPMTTRPERGTPEYDAWKADLLKDWD